MSDDAYVNLGAVIHKHGLGTTQYTSCYTHGLMEAQGRPYLCEGLRLKNVSSDSYHSIRIHPEDAAEFVRRVNEFNIYRGSLFNVTQQILAVQALLNESRGVDCIRTIVHYIRHNRFSEAKAMCFHDADKISRYPELVELIKQLFWSWEAHPWSLLERLRAGQNN